jgi:hypothetical protein
MSEVESHGFDTWRSKFGKVVLIRDASHATFSICLFSQFLCAVMHAFYMRSIYKAYKREKSKGSSITKTRNKIRA